MSKDKIIDEKIAVEEIAENENTTKPSATGKKAKHAAKFRDKLFFMAFVAVWMAIVIWNLATPTKTFSESENRGLTSFPTFAWDRFLDGRFMDDMNLYLNDQFAGKDMWITTKGVMEYGTAKRELNDVLFGDNALLADLKPADDKVSRENIAGLNHFIQQIDVPTYVMLVPSSATVQPHKLPTFAALLWDEAEYINTAYSEISYKAHTIDVLSALQKQNNDYIYYRTDHHWTSYGAFIGYTEFMKAMGQTPLAQSSFEITDLSSNFLGTYHNKTQFPFVDADEMQLYENGKATHYSITQGFDSSVPGTPISDFESIYFDEFLDKKDKYSYYLGQVAPMVTIQTEATNGKKLLVFKDSYAHSFIPMLLGDYSEIVLVDLRYGPLYDVPLDSLGFDISSFDTVLFLHSADVFAHQNITGKFDYLQRNSATGT